MKRLFGILALLLSSSITNAILSNVTYTIEGTTPLNNIYNSLLDRVTNYPNNGYWYRNEFSNTSLNVSFTNSTFILTDEYSDRSQIVELLTKTNEWIYHLPDGYEFQLVTSSTENNYNSYTNGQFIIDEIWHHPVTNYINKYFIQLDNSAPISELQENYIGANMPYENAGYSIINGPCNIINKTIYSPAVTSCRIYLETDLIGWLHFVLDDYRATNNLSFYIRKTQEKVDAETLELLQTIAAQSITNVTTITTTNTITNAVGYTLSEVSDMRVGSQMLSVSNGNATIRMYVDESSDLTSTWSNTQHVLELDIPADADTKFYRFRMD